MAVEEKTVDRHVRGDKSASQADLDADRRVADDVEYMEFDTDIHVDSSKSDSQVSSSGGSNA